MNSKDYWKQSRKISKELNAFLSKFCKINPEFLSIKNDYCHKKDHLNGLQFYGGFIAGGGNKWEKYLFVPVIVELIMIWAYKTNQIVDDKKIVWQNRQSVKDNILEHDLLLSLILKLLESSNSVLKERFIFFDCLVKDMMSAMVRGFQIEKHKLNINFTSLKIILKGWDKAYSNRNTNFNLVYDNIPLIGYWLASGDRKIFSRYDKFFKDKRRFSEVGQIINDVGDWTSVYDNSVRVYQDRFADIRNGIITLPVYRLIDNSFIKEALIKPGVTLRQSWQKNVLLLKDEILDETKKIGKKCFSDLVIFWNENNKSNDNIILQTYLLLKDNKYLKS